MKTFGKRVLDFYDNLAIKNPLPPGVTVLNPYTETLCMQVCKAFYERFYEDDHKRFLILGINPGRYGAGITGIPFTDPIKLETRFGIPNALPKKPELSAEFIHAMINAFGGYEKFFSHFFINSVSPLGFVQDGKNLNYYDTPALKNAITPFIIECISAMTAMGIRRDKVICLGEGENYKFIQKLNAQEKWFDEVIPLAHPRFIMQYKRKFLQDYVDEYVSTLNGFIDAL